MLALIYVYKAHGASYSDQFIGSYSVIPSIKTPIYLVAQHIPYVSLTAGQETPREYLKGLTSRSFDLISAKAREYKVSLNLVLEIIRRESGFDPLVCNKKYGCGSGQGLMQIIPSTFADCEKYFKRDMNVFNAEDNLDCGLHLLSQPNGINHWWDPNGLWGSGPYDMIK